MRVSSRRPFAAWLTVLAACATGCDRATPREPVGGNLVISAFADPDILLPPLTMTGQGLQVVDAVFDRLAQPQLVVDGRSTFTPMLANSWSWSADSLSIRFTINPAARWHDAVAVSATDVRFTWLAYSDTALGAPAAQSMTNVDSVQALDAHTAVFWFKRRSPMQLSDATSQLRILPAHLLDTIPRVAWRTSGFARAPIGSGRFRFANWQAGTRLELVADSTNYRGRPGLDRVVWTVSPDPSAAAMRLFTGDADFLESVRPDVAEEFSKYPDVTLVRSPSLAYGFLQFNLRTTGDAGRSPTVFVDRSLRRALSMAIDRATVVQAVFDTTARVALGPFTRIQVGADTVMPVPTFDAAAASRLLDSLGWSAVSKEGVRTKQGRSLAFTTLVPSSSSQRLRVATILQSQFKAIGVQMAIEKIEFNTMNARLAKGDFDAAVMAIGADPELAGIRGVWSSAAASGGPNFGRYASQKFDALLDSAAAQSREADARRYYRLAHEQILDDAPAIWLYEPWNLSGVRRAVHPVGLRPDGWWMQLGDWTRTAK